MTLTVRPADTQTPEFRLAFEGYEGHHLHRTMLGTILASISETDPKLLVEENWALIEHGYAQWGWPGPWAESREAASKFLSDRGLNGYRISSCYGSEGWVIAKRLVRLGRRRKVQT
jgi:hypothetical protein